SCAGGVPQHIALSLPDVTAKVGTVTPMSVRVTPAPVRMKSYRIPFTYNPDVMFIQGATMIGIANTGASVDMQASQGNGVITISSPTYLPTVSELIALNVEALNSATTSSTIAIDSTL